MKKIIVSVLVIVFLFSCTKERVTNLQYIYINNSNHKLKIYNIGSNIREDITVLPFAEHKGETGYRGTSKPTDDVYWTVGPYDSTKITYNDTLTVYHGSKNHNILRDISKVKHYEYEQVDEYFHKYTYTFTNADFEEAKTINRL